MFGKRIVLLIPHPDDEVVGCAEAIRQAVAQGSDVFGCYLTNGVPHPSLLWPWQRTGHAARVARRWHEAEAAAARLGIRMALRQDIPTRALKDHLAQTAARLDGAFGALRPSVVWAPAYEGGHQDHDVTSYLARRVAERCEVWEFSEYNFEAGRVRSQRFIGPSGGEREIRLDAEAAREKQALLALYASERGNLSCVRCQRECFRPLARYDYTRPPHPGRLFYQRFQWVPWHPRIDHTRPEAVCRAIAAFEKAASAR